MANMVRSDMIAIRVAAALAAALLACQLIVPAAAATSCQDAVGATQAATYVDQCLQVSTATHPPCNASNACALIISEIRRGCRLIGAGAPAFCSAYK
jgi:hypothetical protein